jgi:ketosteroid isomerase-like protein
MKIQSTLRIVYLLIFVVAAISMTAQEGISSKKGKRGQGQQVDMKVLKKQIQGLNNQMAAYMMKMDLDGLMTLYTDDAINLPNYGPALNGKDALKNDMLEFKNKGGKFNNVKFTTKSIEKTGKYIYEIGEYEMTFSLPMMPEPMNDVGKYLIIWERKADDFKVKVDIWNTNVHPMMQGEAKPHQKPDNEFQDSEKMK